MEKDKAKILKSIERERKQSIKDCWKYHKDTLKDYTTKEELEDYLDEIDLIGWEDIGWFVGYLAGLKEAEKFLNK